MVQASAHEIVEILIDEAIRTDQLRDFFFRAAGGDELGRGRHVDAVDIRIPHRRRRRSEVHAPGTGFSRQIDDLRRGRAAHDRIVDQEHVLAAELEIDDIELRTHGLRALLLAGHDERTADVAILDEAFAVLAPEKLRDLHGSRAARIRNGDHDIDVVIRPDAANLFGEQIAHAQARLVHRDVVDDRIGTREVDIFENAWRVLRHRRALMRIEASVFVDEHRLAGPDVAHARKAEHVERDALRGQHVFGPFRRIAFAEHERADAVRIAKAEQAVAHDHRHDGEAAAHAPIDRAHGVEDLRGGCPWGARARELAREHVQEHFGVRARVDVPQVLARQHLRQFGGVRQVAVVPEADPIRRIDEERLRFR